MSGYVDLWLTVPQAEVDWAAEVLCELGSAGVVEASADGGRVQVLGSVPAEKEQSAWSGLEEHVASALAYGRITAAPLIGRAPSAVVDWEAILREHHRPIRAGGVLIRPPWVPPTGEPDVVLEPGMAFGTGSHETTRLCLDALVSELDSRVVGSMLDVGTGSGILALVALRRQPGLRVLACDIDSDAIESARTAAERNGLEQRLDLRLGALDPAWGRFDLVLANLQWNVFHHEAERIATAVAAGGVLLASGLLLDQAHAMAELVQRAGLSLRSRRDDGEWCLLRFETSVPQTAA